MSAYNDFIVCGVSTQLHQLVRGFNELIDEKSDHFSQSGLRQASIIRLGFQAVMAGDKIPGAIGRIDSSLHKNLLERLAKYLVK